MCRCREDVVFVLPDTSPMGTILKGTRCGIIQRMLSDPTASIADLTSGLGWLPMKAKEALSSLEKDGTVVVMNCGGRMMPFLTDRRRWAEMMERDAVFAETEEALRSWK